MHKPWIGEVKNQVIISYSYLMKCNPTISQGACTYFFCIEHYTCNLMQLCSIAHNIFCKYICTWAAHRLQSLRGYIGVMILSSSGQSAWSSISCINLLTFWYFSKSMRTALLYVIISNESLLSFLWCLWQIGSKTFHSTLSYIYRKV